MKDALLALSARSLFFFHGILAFYTVYTELKNMEGMWMIWFLLIPNLALIAEGMYTIAMRGGEEYNWISPCLALYLLSTVPPILFLEYGEFQKYKSISVCSLKCSPDSVSGCDYNFGHWRNSAKKFNINDISDYTSAVATNPYGPKALTLCEMENYFLCDVGLFLNMTSSSITAENGTKPNEMFHQKYQHEMTYEEWRIKTPREIFLWQENNNKTMSWEVYTRLQLKRQAIEDREESRRIRYECSRLSEEEIALLQENPVHECHSYWWSEEAETETEVSENGGEITLEDGKKSVEAATAFVDDLFYRYKLDDIFDARGWIMIFHQMMLVILVVGRWILPKNEAVTRDQLSQILLSFIGIAADIFEFVTETIKDTEIKCNFLILVMIFGIWTWSTLQFALVLRKF